MIGGHGADPETTGFCIRILLITLGGQGTDRGSAEADLYKSLIAILTGSSTCSGSDSNLAELEGDWKSLQ